MRELDVGRDELPAPGNAFLGMLLRVRDLREAVADAVGDAAANRPDEIRRISRRERLVGEDDCSCQLCYVTRTREIGRSTRDRRS